MGWDGMGWEVLTSLFCFFRMAGFSSSGAPRTESGIGLVGIGEWVGGGDGGEGLGWEAEFLSSSEWGRLSGG